MPAFAEKNILLGGAQFGLAYGVSNAQGQTTEREARAILATAHEAGVGGIDTAPGYGDSEVRLGEWAPPGAFHFVTKVPPIRKPRLAQGDVEQALASVRRSRERLRVKKLYAVLMHHAADLLVPGGKSLYEGLQRLRQHGLVDKIGISVYDAAELDAVTEIYKIDIVQVPLNIVDQRLYLSGHLSKLRARGIEVHVRSAFLQGALLMPTAELPPALQSAAHHFARIRRATKGEMVRACLSFLGAIPEVDRLVCGVNSNTQWREILHAASLPPLGLDFTKYALDDERLLNPSKWKLHEAA